MAPGSRGGGAAESNAIPGSTMLPDDADHSVLQQPLNQGVKNIRQILTCVQSGSLEVRDLILNECNVIYECKVCLSLFRSLANFLYHKRAYCKNHLCENMLLFETFDETATTVVCPQPVPDETKCAESTAQGTGQNPAGEDTQDVKENTVANNVPSENASEPSSPSSHENAPDDEPMETDAVVGDSEAKPATHENERLPSEEQPPSSEQPNPGKEVSKVEDVPAEMSPKREQDDKATEEGQVPRTNDIRSLRSMTNSAVKALDIDKIRRAQPVRIELKLENSKNPLSPTKILIAQPIRSRDKCGSIPGSEKDADKVLEKVPVILRPITGNPNAVFQIVKKAVPKVIESTNETEAPESVSSEDSPSGEGYHEEDEKETASEEEPESGNAENQKSSEVTTPPRDIHLSRRKRLLKRSDCSVQELKCFNCNAQFTMLKTLYFHMMSFHSQSRIYYPCPFCKTLFVQMYGVTRHLIQVHGKKKEQINNKLREAIRKRAVWKRVNSLNGQRDDAGQDQVEVVDESPTSDAKEMSTAEGDGKTVEVSLSETKAEDKMFHSYVRVEKTLFLHRCSKCDRVFSRKSSQVSHEKFCIMNSGKQDHDEQMSSEVLTPSPPPFRSASQQQPQSKRASTETKPIVRPKRAAEKQMHEDFVDSQTLKWRSANKIETNSRTAPQPVAKSSKIHERKMMAIINVGKLLCNKCHKKFSSFSNLRRHAAIHIGWTRYKCKVCESYQSYNRSDCRNHVGRHHSIPEEDTDKYVINLVSGASSSSSGGGGATSSVRSVKTKPFRSDGKQLTRNRRKHPPSRFSAPVPKKLAAQPKAKSRLAEDKENSSQDKKTASETKKPSQESKKSSVSPTDSKKTASSETKRTSETTKRPLPDVKKQAGSENKKPAFEVKKDKNPKKPPETKQPQLTSAVTTATVTVRKPQPSYKSVTTSSPTTIILSKTCSSSSVQIVKNHAPISFHDSLIAAKKNSPPTRISVRKAEPEETAPKVGSEPDPTVLNTKGLVKVAQYKIVKQPVNDGDRASKEGDKTPAKKNRPISDWFTKKPSPGAASQSNPLPRREAAPVIIGLVPAGTMSPVRAKPATSKPS